MPFFGNLDKTTFIFNFSTHNHTLKCERWLFLREETTNGFEGFLFFKLFLISYFSVKIIIFTVFFYSWQTTKSHYPYFDFQVDSINQQTFTCSSSPMEILWKLPNVNNKDIRTTSSKSPANIRTPLVFETSVSLLNFEELFICWINYM